jgi:SagB-type dehydrogenase family enzyme
MELRLRKFRLRRRRFLVLVLALLTIIVSLIFGHEQSKAKKEIKEERKKVVEAMIKLPKPKRSGGYPLELLLWRRRSRRDYLDKPLTIEQISHLCWAAYGKLDDKVRTYLSPEQIYSLKLYVVIGKDGVEGIDEGVYLYEPDEHALILINKGDKKGELTVASLNQKWVSDARINFVITTKLSSYPRELRDKSLLLACIDVGAIGENIYLQAEAFDLACVVIGAFYDDIVRSIVSLDSEELPLYVIPVGWRI